MASDNSSSSGSKYAVPSHPVPVSSSAELEISKLFNSRVRSYCADEIRDFANCAKDHYVSVSFTCRDQKIAMNTCLRKYGTMEEKDRARSEWLEGKRQKRLEEEAARRKLEEQESLKTLSPAGGSGSSWFGWFWNITEKVTGPGTGTREGEKGSGL